MSAVTSIEWLGDRVRLIDQTQLPLRESYIETADYLVIADAIRTLKMRGAPAIGIAAAYGVALAGLQHSHRDIASFRKEIEIACDVLASTRPTAVNLFRSIQRMKTVVQTVPEAATARDMLVHEAIIIHQEDEKCCRQIGEHGAQLIPQTATILTHCNTGALATGGEGTAQSVITTAHRQGKSIKVFADETRPLLQGARLTSWELSKAGIECTVITDNMAGLFMKKRSIDLVIVGADRIAANGDTANKIGTYSLAVLAKYHNIPMYIAAPTSTIDPTISSGDQIPIEERSPDEVACISGHRILPEGARSISPAFDVTPANLLTAIITESGIYYPPFTFH
jgi:methylthioribose-1-phosphate isomerase